MAEDFQARICGGNWWHVNSTRTIFPLSSSPCSMVANDTGSYSTWQTDQFLDLKQPSRSCPVAEETHSSLGFLDLQKPHQSESESGSGSILTDSTLQMMAFGLSSPSTNSSPDWTHSLLSERRPERNFHSLLQEEKDWSPAKSFSSCVGAQVSTINDSLKPMNQEFPLDYLHNLSSGSSTVTFPIGSAASYGFPSSVIQSLYEPEAQQEPQHSLFTNRSMAYSSSTGNYVPNSSNDLSPTWSNKVSPFLKPKQQQLTGLHFSNNTPFWNASADALVDLKTGLFGSSQPQYDHQTPKFDEKHHCPNLLTKAKSEEAVPNSATTVKKSNSVSEPAFKRPRIETPSPLPTFKVRKEKLGDRITALQQLVSPFGKTDTASVLHEAIEYIKFLHDQVNVLSTPYLKNGAPPIQHQQVSDNYLKESSEGSKEDLRSRGLCLVPISSTVPVANETTADFWTPTFGGAFIR